MKASRSGGGGVDEAAIKVAGAPTRALVGRENGSLLRFCRI